MKKFGFAMEIFSLVASGFYVLFNEVAFATIFAVYATYFHLLRKEVS